MQKILLTALATLLIAGCAKSDREVHSIEITPAIRTRVTGLHFDTGDRIGLTITKGGETFAGNIPMTYNGTSFTASDLVWYPNTSEKSTLTAYYPYAAGPYREFTIASDQTAGNASSDLLAAVKTDVTPVSAPVSMTFYHMLSQLTVVVTNNTSSPVTGVSIGGFIPTATIDFSKPSASAKSGVAAAEIKAFEVTLGATYRVILVPQQSSLVVTVYTQDGASFSKPLSSAQLDGGKRYDVSVVLTQGSLDVSLSGDIGDWLEGGSLEDGGGGEPGGGEGGGGDPGGEPGDDPTTLDYGGVVYTAATLGGRVWMAESLRYIPDQSLMNNGVYYPGKAGVATSDPEFVRERGLLYSFSTAIGSSSASGGTVQGICPAGWHIPTIEELQTMVGSAEYTAAFFTCAGMWDDANAKYLSDTKGYLMSATTTDGGANYQTVRFPASPGVQPTILPWPKENGVSLRCVKNQ